MEKTIRGLQKSNLILGGLSIVLIVGVLVQANKGLDAEKEIDTLSDSLKNLTEQREEEIKAYESIIEEKTLEVDKAIKNVEEITNQSNKIKDEMSKLEQSNSELNEKLKELQSKINSHGEWLTFTMTQYTADCKGCSGTTATGIDVKSTTTYQGRKVISVDPKQIPLGSIVEINEDGNVYEAQALDTGSAIKGRKIDMLVGSTSVAYEKGVKSIKVKVIRKGW